MKKKRKKKKEKQYGMFSQRQAKTACIMKYNTPDKTPVLISAISKHKDCRDYAYSDKVLLGEITNFICVVKLSTVYGDIEMTEENHNYGSE